MIPRIATGGCSFQGAFQYYGHDKGKSTTKRVAWTHTENMLTVDPVKAVKVMAFTALEQDRLKEASGQVRTGRKLSKPVFTYSLAWHPEQNPTKDQMLEAALQSIKALGLQEHETLIIAHRDEPHKHVHVIVNRVHPLTGIAAKVSHSKRKLSDFAHEYEREHGKIYCPQREQNHLKRIEGERTMYREPGIQEAWDASDSGKSFAAALKDRGYELARGYKRLVVVDAHGKAHNPTRHIAGVKARDVQARLSDIDPASLPDATELSREIQTRDKQTYERTKSYEERVADILNKQQDRQSDEKTELTRELDRKALVETTTLPAEYRLTEQEAEVQSLRAQTEQKGLWSKLMNTVSGIRTKLQEKELSLANARWRYQERVQKLECERAKALAELEQKHATERQKTFELLAKNRPGQRLELVERQPQSLREREQRLERKPAQPKRSLKL